MSEVFNRHVKAVTLRYADKMRALCQPLEKIGISYFTYHVITKQGHYGAVVSRPEWAEYYADHAFYAIDPFIRDMRILQSGVNVKVLNHSIQTILASADQKFNWRGFISLIEKNQLFAECIGFGSYLSNEEAYVTYLENIQQLKNFRHYFKQEAKTVLTALQDHLVDMKALKKDAFTHDLTTKKKSHFTDQLSVLEKTIFDLCYLPASQIAEKLHRSIRTIEHYIDNIKFKLHCASKAELAAKIQEFSIK